MTEHFRALTVAGEELTDPATAEVISPAKLVDDIRQISGSVDTHTVDVTARCAPDTLQQAGYHVIPSHQVKNLERWASPGRETLTIAHHEVSAPDADGDPGRIDALLELAGITGQDPNASSRTILMALERIHGSWEPLRVAEDAPWFTQRELLKQIRRLAMTRMAGRHLRVLTTTSRPLLGLDSTLAVTKNGMATTGISTQLISNLTQFYSNYTMISEAENLAPSAVTNYARLPGSGAAHGLAALTLGLRGSVTPLVEQLLSIPSNRQKFSNSNLIVTTIDTLHPQTVHDSHIGPLAEIAAAQATPLIAFTHETSLSRHEQAEWGLHAVYQVPAGSISSFIVRVLTSTWLRKDVR
ncbi:MAG: glycerate kinase [Actinomycetaceae bacterium]|nr:glycerate kinase [Actinomycetaceae bacterium]